MASPPTTLAGRTTAPTPPALDTVMLLLADGRFPCGGHAHSAGLEAAVAAGRVTGVADLESFLRGRLATAGRVAAAFAAATHTTATSTTDSNTTDSNTTNTNTTATNTTNTNATNSKPTVGGDDRPGPLVELDAELDARTASPALRLASRRQGRALLRAARTVWPSPVYAVLPAHPDGPHHPIALGLAASVAGLNARQAALVAAYGTVSGPASAAVRLLGIDPYQVQSILAELAGACDAIALDALSTADGPPAELPACAAPLTDISAEVHTTWEVRLFAS